jgi:hypothetical protein
LYGYADAGAGKKQNACFSPTSPPQSTQLGAMTLKVVCGGGLYQGIPAGHPLIYPVFFFF